MSHSLSQVIVLLAAGTIMTTIGGLIQLDPAAFHAYAGIDVGDQMALQNELKAAGGALLAVGLLSLAAIFVTPLRSTALTTSAVVYGGYGTARVLSLLTDGITNTSQLWIAGIELAVATACAAVLVRAAQALTPKTI